MTVASDASITPGSSRTRPFRPCRRPSMRALVADCVGTLEDPVLPGGEATEDARGQNSGPSKRRFASIAVRASGLIDARSSTAMRISSAQSISSGMLGGEAKIEGGVGVECLANPRLERLDRRLLIVESGVRDGSGRSPLGSCRNSPRSVRFWALRHWAMRDDRSGRKQGRSRGASRRSMSPRRRARTGCGGGVMSSWLRCGADSRWLRAPANALSAREPSRPSRGRPQRRPRS